MFLGEIILVELYWPSCCHLLHTWALTKPKAFFGLLLVCLEFCYLVNSYLHDVVSSSSPPSLVSIHFYLNNAIMAVPILAFSAVHVTHTTAIVCRLWHHVYGWVTWLRMSSSMVCSRVASVMHAHMVGTAYAIYTATLHVQLTLILCQVKSTAMYW